MVGVVISGLSILFHFVYISYISLLPFIKCLTCSPHIIITFPPLFPHSLHSFLCNHVLLICYSIYHPGQYMSRCSDQRGTFCLVVYHYSLLPNIFCLSTSVHIAKHVRKKLLLFLYKVTMLWSKMKYKEIGGQPCFILFVSLRNIVCAKIVYPSNT